MEQSTLEIFLIAIISLVVTLFVAFLYSKMKKSQYDYDANKAILESIRNSVELQMYNLNDRLVQTEERWKDVNHLLLRNEYLENKNPLSNSSTTYYSEFLKANGIVENDLIVDSRLIFVLTPFNDRYREDYNVIREACTNAGYKCVRGDEKFFTGDIFPEMLKLIVKARLIIANLNGRNPNVLYELGIAQALDKPVILIAKEPEKLPVDIKSKRFLIYSDYNNLQEMIRREVTNLSILK